VLRYTVAYLAGQNVSNKKPAAALTVAGSKNGCKGRDPEMLAGQKFLHHMNSHIHFSIVARGTQVLFTPFCSFLFPCTQDKQLRIFNTLNRCHELALFVANGAQYYLCYIPYTIKKTIKTADGTEIFNCYKQDVRGATARH
jgi:hypothetical protein